MSDDISDRQLDRRPRADKSDGDTAGSGDELELVSTQMLKQILSSNDPENRKAVGVAAKTAGDGVLARDPATGYYKIIGEDELMAIVERRDDLPKLSRPTDVTAEPLHDYVSDEHLSLVSVQALRRVLGDEEEEEFVIERKDMAEFDPYQF